MAESKKQKQNPDTTEGSAAKAEQKQNPDTTEDSAAKAEQKQNPGTTEDSAAKAEPEPSGLSAEEKEIAKGYFKVNPHAEEIYFSVRDGKIAFGFLEKNNAKREQTEVNAELKTHASVKTIKRTEV